MNPAYGPRTLIYFRRKVKLALEEISLTVENNHNHEPQFLEDLKGYDRRTSEGGQELLKSHILNGNSEEYKNDLEAALERLDNGTFGFCQRPGCGQVIPFKRLKAIPQAKYCLRHQVEANKTKRTLVRV